MSGPLTLGPDDHGNEYCRGCRRTRMFKIPNHHAPEIRCSYCSREMVRTDWEPESEYPDEPDVEA